jgi:hypothetical protein
MRDFLNILITSYNDVNYEGRFDIIIEAYL